MGVVEWGPPVVCSRSFVDHALDLLPGLGSVQARARLGGYGLWLQGAVLGLLDDHALFRAPTRKAARVSPKRLPDVDPGRHG